MRTVQLIIDVLGYANIAQSKDFDFIKEIKF